MFILELSLELLFFFDSRVEGFDLVSKKIPKKQAQFLESQLAGFILFQNFKAFFIFLLEVRINVAVNLVAFHEASYKFTDLVDGKGALVISIASIINIPTHIAKFDIINKDVCKVLDRLGIVDLCLAENNDLL